MQLIRHLVHRNITGPVLDLRMNKNQLFDIYATYVLPVNTLKPVTKINCSIALPEVGHTSSRLVHYHKSGKISQTIRTFRKNNQRGKKKHNKSDNIISQRRAVFHRTILSAMEKKKSQRNFEKKKVTITRNACSDMSGKIRSIKK